MIERLLDLIMRLKKIFLKIEEKDSGDSKTAALQAMRVLELTKVNEESLVELDELNSHILGMQDRMDSLDKDHQEALAMLDELEEVIKKWES